MEFSQLRDELDNIHDERAAAITGQLKASLDRMIDIGLPYLFMNRESSTLSGGEVVFTRTPKEMIDSGRTITAKYLRKHQS
ncbi:MAG: hypothetical protein PUA84_05250 [Oscillospiraceae bacterium]|nr:hypothetical protein [Oscillospiraceae bacterium]